MKRVRGLTAECRKSAALRCKDIEEALTSLLLDVLNGQAYAADMDRVAALAREVRRLRYRFESYPVLPDSRGGAKEVRS